MSEIVKFPLTMLLDNAKTRAVIDAMARSLMVAHYSGFILSQITRLFRGQIMGPIEGVIDQHQSNAAWGIHQARIRIPGDPTTYRLILAPSTAPITVGTIPIDQHFVEKIT